MYDYTDAPSAGELARDAYIDEMEDRRARGEVTVLCGYCGYLHASVEDVKDCWERIADDEADGPEVPAHLAEDLPSKSDMAVTA